MDYEGSKPNPGDVMCRAHWADLLLLNKIMLGTDLGEKEEEGSFQTCAKDTTCTARFRVSRPTPWDTTIIKEAGIGQIGHLFHISIEPKPLPGVVIIGATLYPQHAMLIIKNPKAKLESTDPDDRSDSP